MEVGGKLLTKLLAKSVSFKQYKMENYFQTINKMKEEICYIESNMEQQMNNIQNLKKFYYCLPDPDIGKEG